MIHPSLSSVLILGAGVSGLSCGIRLLEAGYGATIWARDLPPHTTSNIAAAIWYPYKAYPFERVLAWSERTFDVFCTLADDSNTGVRLRETLELLQHHAPDPWWRSAVHDFRHATATELPIGFADGYVFTTPVIEMDVYLPYLIERFRALGGTLIQRAVADFAEVLSDYPVVVNCTGLGSRDLANDHTMFPIRGQIIRTTLPVYPRAVLDDAERGDMISYIIPRSADCIVGGTVQPQNWSLEPDPATADAMLTRATTLVPSLADVEILEHRVGLRPGRNVVRLEVEQMNGGVVVHNYGHGGAGVTLSWGCAESVLECVQTLAG